MDARVRAQVLAGVEYQLSDPLMLGVRVRWLPARAFASDPTEWTQLRSHESSVGRGEPTVYTVTTDNNQFWGLSLTMRYQF